MIISLDDYIASAKQTQDVLKTAAVTAVAANWFSVFDKAGDPGAGTLAIGNTAAGVVPTDAVAGYPAINAFGAGAIGYLSRVRFTCSVACRIALYDRVFAAGAYNFNDVITLAAQPTFAARVPNADYKDIELWVEGVVALTGGLTLDVGYTNADGTAGRTTGGQATGIATANRCYRMPLQAGDNGIQQIDSVTASVASAGTFNAMLLRPLADARIPVAGGVVQLDMLGTGLPQVYADSALYLLVAPDSTSTGIPSVRFEIANK